MAIKSADQITIIDVTDAYSVMLTSEAYTFIGSTSGVAAGASCTTEAVAFCGTNQCSAVNAKNTAIAAICFPHFANPFLINSILFLLKLYLETLLRDLALSHLNPNTQDSHTKNLP